jgi:hypothetical protein
MNEINSPSTFSGVGDLLDGGLGVKGAGAARNPVGTERRDENHMIFQYTAGLCTCSQQGSVTLSPKIKDKAT